MFERLLELLLHAKSGAIAAVLVLGTTGALVTATVQSGVTTITITEASPSPTLVALTSATKSPKPSPNTLSSLTSSTLTECKANFEASVAAMHTVNQAFSKDHTDLMHLREGLRTDVARKAIESADKQLKQIRMTFAETLRATTSCFKRDEDKAEKQDETDSDTADTDKADTDTDKADTDKPDEANDENDNEHTTVTLVVVTTVTPTPTPTPAANTTTTTTSTDPKVLADQAVAAMKLVLDTVKAQLPASNVTPKTAKSPEVRSLRTTTSGGDHLDGRDSKDGERD